MRVKNFPNVFSYSELWSVRLSVRTQAFHACKRGSIPLRSTNFGLKVFMDAHSTVTAEEGDRYPLGPPSLRATSPGYFLFGALGPATVALP